MKINKVSYLIIAGLILVTLVLSGCTTCPEQDCNSCPPKIEYQEKEVIKTEYKDRIVNKYQCFDGSFVEDISKCKNIQELRDSMTIVEKDDLCSDPKNYNLQQIKIDNFLDSTEITEEGSIVTHFQDTGKRSNLGDFEAWVKWYPSLNEGYILGYPINVENIGCTKLDVRKLSASIYLYYGGQLIAKNEKSSYGFEMLSSLGNEIYPDGFVSGRVTFKDNMMDAAHEISKTGDYPVKVIVYYDGKEVEIIEDVIVVH